MLVQSISEVFRVLVPSLASSINTLGSSSQSQVANRTLTDVSLIARTLTSAVNGITGAASNGSAADTAGAAVSGVADTVSAIASAFGRRLLHDGSSASSRQLLQSAVRLLWHICALMQDCVGICALFHCVFDFAFDPTLTMMHGQCNML